MQSINLVAPIAGGALVGLGAGGYWLTHGRIAGVSGLCASLVDAGDDARGAKGAFLAGLVLCGAVIALMTPSAFANSTSVPAAAVLLAGLLVGYGARLGNGCTSGHGICGLGRVSVRSIAACTLFSLAGMGSLLLCNLVTGGLR